MKIFYLRKHLLFQEFYQSWFFFIWTRGLFRLCGATRKDTMNFVQQRGSFLLNYYMDGVCLNYKDTQFSKQGKVLSCKMIMNWAYLEEDRNMSLKSVQQ